MRETMSMLIVLVVLFTAIALGLVALGVVLGFALHATFSTVDLGTGILIGVVTAGLSIHFLVRVLHLAEALEGQAEEGEAGDRVVYYLPSAIPTRRNRNRRKKRE